MRRQVLELMTMAQRHSLSSFAIDSVKPPSVVTLGNEPDTERFPGCVNEFGAEFISHPPVPGESGVSLNQEEASRLPQIKWHITLYGEAGDLDSLQERAPSGGEQHYSGGSDLSFWGGSSMTFHP